MNVMISYRTLAADCLLSAVVCSGYQGASTPTAETMPVLKAGQAPDREAFRPDAADPTRRALLVGINTYRNGTSAAAAERGSVRGWTNLEGPLNDVAAIQALLTTRFGFSPENVHVLTEEAATNAGTRRAVRDLLIAPSAAGEQVVFVYAGHGSFVHNSKAPEPDKRDEMIVPYDVATVGDVRDKELRADRVTLSAPNSAYLFGSISTPGTLRPETDTFFLLATADPLPDPNALLTFRGTGARGPEERELAGAHTPLASLLFDVSGGMRGVHTPVPTNWFVMRSPMVSAQ